MTNSEIVRKCMADRECDLSKYDGVLTVTLVIGGKPETYPVWRVMESLLWVTDQDTSEVVPFRLRWPQRVLYAILCEQKIHGMPMRCDILKARQLGLSTFVAGLYFILTMFRPNTRTCIMADLEQHSSNLFSIYKGFYDHLCDSLPDAAEIAEDTLEGKKNPNDIRPTLSHLREGLMMKTEVGGSTIECVTAGVSAGRSAHYRYIHDSETAFQKNSEETCVSLFSTVSTKDTESIIIIETTAKGYNDYKTRWDSDAAGNTAFAAVFFPWYAHPGYTMKAPTKCPNYPMWFFAKWKEHPEITPDQMFWYWNQYGIYNNEQTMKQEYPWEPEDAFISTGMSVFDSALVKKRMDSLIGISPRRVRFTFSKSWSEDGQTVRVTDIREEESASEAAWKVYSEPKKGVHYVAICDPTKGDNNDFSAIQVLEQNTGRQAAVYNAKERLEDVAYQLYCAGKHWNNALVSSENNTGPSVLELLTKMYYGNIYVSQSAIYDNFNQTYTSKLGHDTTKGNRDAMIQDFVMAFREDPTIVQDYDTLSQMQTFQYVRAANSDRLKAQASARKYHDDLVMSYVPFWRVRIQQDFDRRPLEEKGEARKLTDGEVEMMVQKRLMERHREQSKRNRVRNITGITW